MNEFSTTILMLLGNTSQSGQRERDALVRSYFSLINLIAFTYAGGRLPTAGEYLTAIARLHGSLDRLEDRLTDSNRAVDKSYAYDFIHRFWTDERLALLSDEARPRAAQILEMPREVFVAPQDFGATPHEVRLLRLAESSATEETYYRTLWPAWQEEYGTLNSTQIRPAQVAANREIVRGSGLHSVLVEEIEVLYTQSENPRDHMSVVNQVQTACIKFAELLNLPTTNLVVNGQKQTCDWRKVLEHAKTREDLVVMTDYEVRLQLRLQGIEALTVEHPVLVGMEEHGALRDGVQREAYMRFLDQIGLDPERCADFATGGRLVSRNSSAPGTHFLFEMPHSRVVHVGIDGIDGVEMHVRLIQGDMQAAKLFVQEMYAPSSRLGLDMCKELENTLPEAPPETPRSIATCLRLERVIREHRELRATAAAAYSSAISRNS
jgi:hypothetical protein